MPAANLAYGFDPLSTELASITCPSSLVVSYSRYADGRISAIAADGQEMIRGITYKPFGPAADYLFGNSPLSVDRAYDLLYQLSSAQAGSMCHLSYNTDAAGNVTALNDLINPPANQSFDYDDLGRLSSATGAYGSIAYSYDAVGNRQSMGSGEDTDSYAYTAIPAAPPAAARTS